MKQTVFWESLIHVMMANTEDFLQGGDSRNCFGHTIFEQCSHAKEAGLAADGLGRLAVESHFPNAGAHAQHLEDALAATETSVMTVIAAPSTGEIGSARLCRR